MLTVAQAQLKNARTNGSGRSSATVYKGNRLALTVVALTEGTQLSDLTWLTPISDLDGVCF